MRRKRRGKLWQLDPLLPKRWQYHNQMRQALLCPCHLALSTVLAATRVCIYSWLPASRVAPRRIQLVLRVSNCSHSRRTVYGRQGDLGDRGAVPCVCVRLLTLCAIERLERRLCSGCLLLSLPGSLHELFTLSAIVSLIPPLAKLWK